MPVTSYRTHNGRVRGESTGASRTTYLTDALGSVTATVDATQAVVNTYRAKPYGSRLARTGSGPDPAYEWTGDTGSRRTGLAYAEQHNRRRHLGTRQASWTGVDPLWPDESSYVYVAGNPATWLDPSGRAPCKDCCDEMRAAMNGDPNASPTATSAFDELKGRCNGFWVNTPPDGSSKPCRGSSCGNILSRLRDTAVPRCLQMCDKSKTPPSGPPYGSNDTFAASPYCCGGKPCFVLWCVRSDGQSENDPCVLTCISVHENRHFKQQIKDCGGKIPPPPGVPDPSAWGECDAYQQEVQCLLAQARKNGCPVPRSVLQDAQKCRGYKWP